MWSKNRLEISDEFLVNFTNKSMIFNIKWNIWILYYNNNNQKVYQ